jgi:bifunctional non-homologous end joining protein LigD
MARAPAKLAKYRSMRNFGKTSEPSGDKPIAPGSRFVVQKHAARRLHYDFRLELDGVLLSWAVPKGPSMKPGDRRLAVQTEDHPIDYGDFEGIIPAGEYGGGTVVVWDRGSWQPEGNPRDAVAKGKLTFTLDGEKLRGRFHLVRTKGDQKGWLLFKGRDDLASEQGDITLERPESVVTGRTVEEVAAAADRVWHSNKPSTPTVAQRRAARIATKSVGRGRASPQQIHALVASLPLGFQLTSLDKVLYPEQGLTKGELIAYIAVVAEYMLPHVGKRPLTIVRCPEGRHKPCFFQKHILAGSPPAIHTLPITEVDGEIVEYMSVDDMPGLVALAQLGTLEIHTWGSHADEPEKPDLMVFDLDPGEGVTWDEVALAAFQLRRRLDDLGFVAFVKTTGGKGLHVAVPTKRGPSWDDFKGFTKAVVEAVERDAPDRFTTNMAKVHRRRKIFLDYLRNGRNATFIAPYSPRARDGAPVAMPIEWEQLAEGVDPKQFTTATVPAYLAGRERDPWADFATSARAITAAARRAVTRKS